MAFIEKLFNKDYRNPDYYEDFQIYYVIVESHIRNKAFDELHKAFRYISQDYKQFISITVIVDYYAISSGKTKEWHNFLLDIISKNRNWGHSNTDWGMISSSGENEMKVREQLRVYNCEFDYVYSMCIGKSWKKGFWKKNIPWIIHTYLYILLNEKWVLSWWIYSFFIYGKHEYLYSYV